MNFYTETGVQHIETLVRHLQYGTTCGNAALISAEVYQVFLGIKKPFLECSASAYLHRDKTQWMDFVWEFCTTADLKITISQAGNQKKPFQRDAALMDIAQHEASIPSSLAQRINRCRLWLKVKYVSEIFDATTNIIYPWACSGDNIPYTRARFSTMSKSWPDQSKCMRSDWNAWYEFVKHHLLTNGERAP